MITKQRKLVKIEDEIWREVPNSHNRYHVSNYGRVKSFAINKTEGEIFKTYLIKGFKTVHLSLENNKNTNHYVHKLVAELWLPKPSDDHKFVCHKDGNKTNNHISNLEWMTQEMLHAHHRKLRQQIGFGRPKDHTKYSKLKESDVKLLKTMLQRGTPQYLIAKMFCISEMQVTRIKRGENWGHVSI